MSLLYFSFFYKYVKCYNTIDLFRQTRQNMFKLFNGHIILKHIVTLKHVVRCVNKSCITGLL